MEYREKNLKKINKLILDLFINLKDMGIRDHTGTWLQFLHWDQKMNEKQHQARLLMDKIVQIILIENSQISKRIIYQRVVYNLLQTAVWESVEPQEFLLEALKEISILFEYQSIRPIDIPIVYLFAENPPVKFGVVTIHAISEEDRSNKWWEKILSAGGTEYSVRAYARIDSKGDLQISVENAKEIVNDMLLFLRAINFPFTTKQQNQFGLINEFSTLLIPYRLGKPRENYRLEYQVEFSTLTSQLHNYEIQQDIFSQISLDILGKLQDLIENDYYKSSTKLRHKFLLGLRWLGEATKPDILSARFVKLSFSLEGFIGGEINNSRDTKIILAKRCAVLAASDIKNQKKIYNLILTYYDKRSHIVHGNDIVITEKDLSDFGNHVRKIAWALLKKIDDFTDIGELHKWAMSNSNWSTLNEKDRQ